MTQLQRMQEEGRHKDSRKYFIYKEVGQRGYKGVWPGCKSRIFVITESGYTGSCGSGMVSIAGEIPSFQNEKGKDSTENPFWSGRDAWPDLEWFWKNKQEKVP